MHLIVMHVMMMILTMTCGYINGSERLSERPCIDAYCGLAGGVVHTNPNLVVITMKMMLAMIMTTTMMTLTRTILLSTMRERECQVPRLCSVT